MSLAYRDCFLSDGLNHRTDTYGGSLENRARFPLACIQAVRAAIPAGMPLFMRIDAQDNGFPEGVDMTIEDTITFCKWAGQPIEWKCAFGHTFRATPNTVLRGGHWCPECLRHEWQYAEIARKNPFYAQVWTPIHGDRHDYRVPMAFSAYDIAAELKEEIGVTD